MDRQLFIFLFPLLLFGCVSQSAVEPFGAPPSVAVTALAVDEGGSDRMHLDRIRTDRAKLAVFVNREVPKADRLTAVHTMEPLTDFNNAVLASGLFSDRAAAQELRIRGLILATDALRRHAPFKQELYATVVDSTEPIELRHAVARSLAQIHYYISFVPSEKNPDISEQYYASLRKLKTDPDDHLRTFGISSLMRLGDTEMIKSVNNMLSGEQPRALPLGKLLKLVVTQVNTRPYFSGLGSVLNSVESIDDRAMSARMLGRSESSKNALLQMATDPQQDERLGLAALSALNAGRSDDFEAAAKQILTHNAGFASPLQVYAISALALDRSSIEKRYKSLRTADHLDNLITSLADKSRNSEVVKAAQRYLKNVQP